MENPGIYEVIDGIKKNARQFAANFYVLPDGLDAWGRRGWNWLFISRDFAAWYRQEPACRRLYFAGEIESIETAMKGIDDSAAAPLVVDLIGDAGAVEFLAAIFEKARFRRHEKLMRLSVSTEALTLNLNALEPPAARFAQLGDVPEIYEVLLSDFDPLSDQPPDEKELADAVENSSILVIPSPKGVKGFVYFQRSGVTAMVRYWAVHSEFRNRGIGRELLRAYLLHTNGSKRNLLWVKGKNENALKRYFHYGYRPDGMTDQILIRQAGGTR